MDGWRDGGREGERETEITSISVYGDKDNEIESADRERPDSRASMRSSVSAARFSNSLASATFLSCKLTEATQERASGNLVEIPLLHR